MLFRGNTLLYALTVTLLYLFEPRSNVHFYRQHLLLPVEWIWSAEAGAGMPPVMWPGCSSKLNVSSGSKQKGHSVRGRGREPLRKWSVKEQLVCWRTAHTYAGQVDKRRKPLLFQKVSFGSHFRFSECLSSLCKIPFFVLFGHTKWTRSVEYMGLKFKQMCLSATSNTQWHRSVWTFALPYRHYSEHVSNSLVAEGLSRVTPLNKCTLFQKWLLFQASSSTWETTIRMIVKLLASHVAHHLLFIMLRHTVC